MVLARRDPPPGRGAGGPPGDAPGFSSAVRSLWSFMIIKYPREVLEQLAHPGEILGFFVENPSPGEGETFRIAAGLGRNSLLI